LNGIKGPRRSSATNSQPSSATASSIAENIRRQFEQRVNLGAREIAGDQKGHRRGDRRRDDGDRGAPDAIQLARDDRQRPLRASEMMAKM